MKQLVRTVENHFWSRRKLVRDHKVDTIEYPLRHQLTTNCREFILGSQVTQMNSMRISSVFLENVESIRL